MADEPTAAPEAGEGTAPTNSRTYTDSDMAKLRQSERKRYERALDQSKTTAPNAVAEELGFSDADEMREFFSSARERQPEIERTQSELKKLQREREKLAKELDEQRSAYDSIKGEYHGGRVQDAITTAAVKAGAIDPADFVLRLKAQFSVEDGEVRHADGLSLDDAIKAVADNNPRFLRPSGGEGADSNPPSNSAKDGPDLLSAEGRMKKLRAAGII